MINTLEQNFIEFNKIHLLANILWYDGPLLSILKNEIDKNYYFWKWLDVDEKYNRWLIFKVSTEQIKNCLTGCVSLREIICHPIVDYYLIYDMTDDVDNINERVLSFKDLPEDYLPSENSFFERGLSGMCEDDWNIVKQRFLT